MITVTHRCGHAQVAHFDEYSEEVIQRRLGKSREQFMDEQRGFLERNLCLGCYNAAKKVYPGLKPC